LSGEWSPAKSSSGKEKSFVPSSKERKAKEGGTQGTDTGIGPLESAMLVFEWRQGHVLGEEGPAHNWYSKGAGLYVIQEEVTAEDEKWVAELREVNGSCSTMRPILRVKQNRLEIGDLCDSEIPKETVTKTPM